MASLAHRKPTFVPRSAPMTIKNDITVNIGLKLSVQARAITGGIGRAGLIWLAAANVNSEYELYLQKTMIRDVYDMYRRITDYTRKRTLNFSDYTGESEINRIERLSGAMFHRFVDYVSRRVVYDSDLYPQIGHKVEERPVPPPAEPLTTFNGPQIQEKIEKEFQAEGHDVMNVIDHLSIDGVMDKVYKKLADSMRHERLRKGLR